MTNLKSTIISVSLLLLTATNVNAGSWICEHGNLVREINVQTTTSNPAPCSVVYNKDAEGQGSKVLWTATSDGSYCDAKADGLAAKLEGYGWACSGF